MASSQKVRDRFLQESDLGMIQTVRDLAEWFRIVERPDDVSSAYAIGHSIRTCRPLSATRSRNWSTRRCRKGGAAAELAQLSADASTFAAAAAPAVDSDETVLPPMAAATDESSTTASSTLFG